MAMRGPLAQHIPEDQQGIPSSAKHKANPSGSGGGKLGRGATHSSSSSRHEAAKRANITLNVSESSSQLPVAK